MNGWVLGLVLTAVAPGAGPGGQHPPVAGAPAGGAKQALREVCEAGAWDPDSPWAVAHGVLAFGPGWHGGAAIAALGVRAERDPRGGWNFPAATSSGAPLSPHPGLIVKTLVRAGIDPAAAFSTPRGPVTLTALEASLVRALPWPLDGVQLRQLPWVLEVIARTHRPGQRLQTAAGPVPVDAVFDAALGLLEQDSSALAAGLARGEPVVPKEQVALGDHPCGGLHLVQALAAWAGHPEVRRRWGRRWTTQEAVFLYRAGSEERQYAEALEADPAPAARVLVLAQRLKFEGHWLETARLLRAAGSFPAGPAAQAAVARTRRQLAQTVDALARAGILRGVVDGRAAGSQLARDLVGDACHAVAGLDE